MLDLGASVRVKDPQMLGIGPWLRAAAVADNPSLEVGQHQEAELRTVASGSQRVLGGSSQQHDKCNQ